MLLLKFEDENKKQRQKEVNKRTAHSNKGWLATLAMAEILTGANKSALIYKFLFKESRKMLNYKLTSSLPKFTKVIFYLHYHDSSF